MRTGTDTHRTHLKLKGFAKPNNALINNVLIGCNKTTTITKEYMITMFI